MLKNLKKLREAQGLSQDALAKKLHISQQSIAKYEVGPTLPSTDILISLADYFNTSMDYLVGRSEIETRINAISENDLNRDEDFLLREFRSYDIDQQNAMLQMMESFKPY